VRLWPPARGQSPPIGKRATRAAPVPSGERPVRY
jgi:hypothetical protein